MSISTLSTQYSSLAKIYSNYESQSDFVSAVLNQDTDDSDSDTMTSLISGITNLNNYVSASIYASDQESDTTSETSTGLTAEKASQMLSSISDINDFSTLTSVGSYVKGLLTLSQSDLYDSVQYVTSEANSDAATGLATQIASQAYKTSSTFSSILSTFNLSL